MITEFGWNRIPTWMPQTALNTAYTSRNLSASTHWAGGQFQCLRTGTIDTVWFLTGSVSSPVNTLKAEIAALDANGYPKGASVAVSSTGVVNASANTMYSVTISAAVTAGSWYGVRVYYSAYTSGSVNVAVHTAQRFFEAASYVPTNSHNIGSDSKNSGLTAIGLKYSDGYYPILGLVAPSATFATLSTAASSGDVIGNKFTIDRHIKVIGYYCDCDPDTAANFELYSGSDNTAMTGSSVTITPGHRALTFTGPLVYFLSAPLLLPPGTYRMGLKTTTAAAISLKETTGLAEAGILAMHGEECRNVMKTVYTSGAWTDTSTGLTDLMLVYNFFHDGKPDPGLTLGI